MPLRIRVMIDAIKVEEDEGEALAEAVDLEVEDEQMEEGDQEEGVLEVAAGSRRVEEALEAPVAEVAQRDPVVEDVEAGDQRGLLVEGEEDACDEAFPLEFFEQKGIM